MLRSLFRLAPGCAVVGAVLGALCVGVVLHEGRSAALLVLFVALIVLLFRLWRPATWRGDQ